MKTIFPFLFLMANSLMAQQMTNARLQQIVHQQSDSIYQSKVNFCRFQKRDRSLICITDSIANRMRIISPISDIQNLSSQHIVASLAANFHTALDVKYAVSDGVLWSVYIHPLKELSENQLIDAINQVYNANVTFGSTYQSTHLIFGGGKEEDQALPKKVKSKKI